MKRVVVLSPLRGDYEKNTAYAKACLRDCFARGEAPYASHVLYPLVLDDTSAEERRQGMEAGRAWFPGGELCAVYTDLGISEGMKGDLERIKQVGLEIEYRELGEPWSTVS
jgi:hypothetical protein